jgi:hypothetical protein
VFGSRVTGESSICLRPLRTVQDEGRQGLDAQCCDSGLAGGEGGTSAWPLTLQSEKGKGPGHGNTVRLLSFLYVRKQA